MKWSGYEWRKNEVKKSYPFTKEPHYVVVVFTQSSEFVPGYDERDSGSYQTSDAIQMFAFNSEEEVKAIVEDLISSNMKYVFYKVEKLGEAKINISLT